MSGRATDFMVVWCMIEGSPRTSPGHYLHLLLERVAVGAYRLLLPPVPRPSRLVGILFLQPAEFFALTYHLMDQYVLDRGQG